MKPFIMSISVKPALSSTLILLCFAAFMQAQTKNANSDSATPQEHFDAAQRFQREDNLDKAAVQYRAFLADVVGELAVGYADLGEYSKAASSFDDALSLVPDSPALQLKYAAAALALGDFPHAETLAREFLREYPLGQEGSEQAHQILGRALLKMNRNQDARKELELAVDLDPTFENGYDLAVACLNLNDGKCAQQIFGEMLASFGDSAAIHMRFGRAYQDSEFRQQAVEEFKKVIAANPHFQGVHYALAAALLAPGGDAQKTQEAETELKKELFGSPFDFLTYAALGEIAVSQHQYAQAEKYLKRATDLNPKNPDAFLYLGQMFIDTNRLAEAEACLRTSILLTTNVSRNRYQVQQAHLLLSGLLMRQKKNNDARAEMQISHSFSDKGLSEDSGMAAGHLDLPKAADTVVDSTQPPAEAKAKDPEAVRRLKTFEKQVTPAVADSYNNLGAIAAQGGDYARALIYFQRAWEWSPSLQGLDYNWGRAAFLASRFADAIMPLSHYLVSHQDDSSTRVSLGISQFMTHDYDGCVKTLQPAEGTPSTIPQVEFVYADSLVKTGQILSGLERLKSLEASHPEIAEVHRALGEALRYRDKKQNAIDELQIALKLDGNDPETHYDLGKIELERRNTVSAIQELEASVHLLPGNAKFHQDLASAYRLAARTADAEKETMIYNELRADQTQPAQQNK
jgi:tetratricopeptide (TPR) repeat protein